MLAAALLALAATAAAVAAPRPHTPVGFRRHVLEGGLAVALPIGWQVVGQRDAGSPGVLQSLRHLDPDFAAPAAQLASPDSPLKLFAFDRAFWDHRATSVMLLRATSGRPAGYARWAAKAVAELQRAPGRVGAVRHSRVNLPAGAALRATYLTSNRDRVTAYFVAGGDGLWALVFRTPAARAAAVTRLFHAAAATLELPPRPPGSKPGA
jgi:hypothetical protein